VVTAPLKKDTTIVKCLKNDCAEKITYYYRESYLHGEYYQNEEKQLVVNKIYYDKSNILASIDTLERATIVGTSLQYHPNGQLHKTVHRDKNGQKVGLCQFFYKNGQLSLSFYYENDQQNGPMRQYYPNGKLKQTGGFKNNRYNGEFILYDTKGNITSVKKYEEGVEVK
jgi:antitoxin component YwqK of YwqJK toxin-antitoxin module